MKHHVSAAAANHFWDLSLQYVPLVLNQRQRKVPKFNQKRRRILEDHCPPIYMEFFYRNRYDGTIVHYKGSKAPIKAYQNDHKYEKLYELAYVKVNPYLISIIISTNLTFTFSYAERFC